MHSNHSGEMPDRLLRRRTGRFVVHFDRSVEFEVVAKALLVDPDRILAEGQGIASEWKGPATDKAIVRIGGSSYFLKRYNCHGRGYRWKYIFRNSRALKSWWAAWKFLELGLPTPAPLVCLEERRFRILGRSFLLFELCDGAKSLLELWDQLADSSREKLISILASTIGSMHRQGILHGDLNWRNILIKKTDERLSCYLVDLDGCRFLARPDRKTLERDLAHFLRDMERSHAPNIYRSHFLELWRKCVFE